MIFHNTFILKLQMCLIQCGLYIHFNINVGKYIYLDCKLV